MDMTRKFNTVDDEATRNLTVSLREALPPNHWARFVADVIAHLDVSRLSARSGTRGGDPFAPELRLGLLVYGYATGVFSARMIEQATHASLPCRFLAGALPPDHDTIAPVRQMFLPEVKDLLVQILLLAPAADVLKLGHISLDGTTLHADASNSHAVSDQRLLALEHPWRAEVDAWFALGEQAEQVSRPAGRRLADEMARRQARLANLAPAQAVLAARAQARYQAERPAYEATRRAREENARTRQPRGPQPQPPPPGPRDRDQYHCTDPESCLRKHRHNDGFDQHDHAPSATDQTSVLVVAHSWSNHANDQAAVEPTLAAWPEVVGTPPAGALDPGDCSAANMTAWEPRGLEPSIAVGREPPHQPWSA
jgi:transposase